MKIKKTYGILAILLGGVGVHFFYAGKNGYGILSILFSWTFVTSIIGIVLGIMALCSSEEEFQKKFILQE